MMEYLLLVWEFFKTGLFSVGGGLATLPFLYKMAEKTGWFQAQDIGDMIAISESTPGAIGVNMSTYVGYTVQGVPGAVLTTLGLITPSIIVIILISKVLEQFKNSVLVKDVFYGLRPASTALITAAGLGVAKMALLRQDLLWDTAQITQWVQIGPVLLAIAVFIGLRKWKKIHPVVFIGVSALVGIIFQL